MMNTSRHIQTDRRATERDQRWGLLHTAAVLLAGLVAIAPSMSRGGDQDTSAETPIRLHYEPAVGDLGDPIPFFWNGIYHVFYLNYPKSGENRPYVWSHISSRDLIRWTEHPNAIEGCLTGSIVEKDGLFHAFTTEDGRVGHATSRDLDTWNKDPSFIMAIDPRWYEASWRDPCVVWNPADKQYWMAICSRTKSDGNNSMTGCVALATSPDLATWTIAPPLWAPQFSTWLECPDLFPCGDKWVLLYYWRQTQVRLADSPLGPWLRPPVESPNSWNCVAAKTMWDGKRRIQIGCLPRRPCYCGAPTGGCTFLVPREWYLSSDNVPSTRPAAEVIATYAKDPTEGRAAQVFAPSMSDWDIHGDTAVAAATPNRSAMALWRDAPANYYLRATLRFEPGSSATFLIRGQSADSAYGRKTPTDTGYQLILEPDQRLVSLRRWYEWNQRGPINEMPYTFSKDGGTVVEIFLDGDIIEVFLDGRSSLVARLPENITGSLALLAREGKVVFEDIRVRTL